MNHKNPHVDTKLIIRVTEHALVRMIMRSGQELKTPSQLKRFLSDMARPLTLAAMETVRRMEIAATSILGKNGEVPELDDPKFEEVNLAIGNKLLDLYVIINGFYMPLHIEYLASERLINRTKSIHFPRVLTVKTFMPREYESSVKMLAKKKPVESTGSAFDYRDVVKCLA